MHLPGSRQMGFAKAFLQQYPWHRFEPHPEWAAFLPEPAVGTGSPGGPSNEPQAAGIADSVRIIYVPEALSIEVRSLQPQSRYEAKYFDPVSGESGPPLKIQSDQSGKWQCPPPTGNDHDWVLALEKQT
jgi:hypothetical protein